MAMCPQGRNFTSRLFLLQILHLSSPSLLLDFDCLFLDTELLFLIFAVFYRYRYWYIKIRNLKTNFFQRKWHVTAVPNKLVNSNQQLFRYIDHRWCWSRAAFFQEVLLVSFYLHIIDVKQIIAQYFIQIIITYVTATVLQAIMITF